MHPKLERIGDEPILTPTKFGWENRHVYNAAAVYFRGRVALVYRAQGDDMISRLGLAFLENGTKVAERFSDPIFVPDTTNPYETLGVEDPRIVQIGDHFYMTYTAASYYPDVNQETYEASSETKPGWRVRVSLAATPDFQNFTRYGVIIEHIDSKDGALFPKRFGDHYVLMHRVLPSMRLAVSHDLVNYSERGPLIIPREGKFDELRVGAGAPPIETPYGWLSFYHGADGDNVYHLGMLLCDLKDPGTVLARSDEPILSPEKTFEKRGLVSNVVFTCGAVELGDEYYVYYGAADQAIGVAKIAKKTVFAWIKEQLKKNQ